MSDIAEKIAALEAACNKAAEEGGMFARDWERLSSIQNVRQLIAHIRQQEAELATLREQIKRAEEQEPVRFLYKDVYSFGVLYGDIVTNTRQDCSYKDSRGEWVKGQPLYTEEPK